MSTACLQMHMFSRMLQLCLEDPMSFGGHLVQGPVGLSFSNLRGLSELCESVLTIHAWQLQTSGADHTRRLTVLVVCLISDGL